ncbi:MAG: hypothetical protein Q9187_008462, partial [Circinaria calcarea]
MESSELRSSKRRKTITSVSVVPSSPNLIETLQSPSVSRAVPRQSSRPLVTYGHNRKKDCIAIDPYGDTTTALDTGEDGAVLEHGKPAAFADSAYHSMSTHGEASDRQEDLGGTPSKRKRPAEAIGRLRVDITDESEGEAIVLYQTPRKKRKQAHRSCPESTNAGSLGDKVILVGQQTPFEDLEWISPAMGNPVSNTASNSRSTDGDANGLAKNHGGTEDSRPTRSSGRQRKMSTKSLMTTSEATVVTPTKPAIRKRGRPRKISVPASGISKDQEPQLQPEGYPGTPELTIEDKENQHPPKSLTRRLQPVTVDGSTPAKRRGRPPKTKPKLPSPFDNTVAQSALHEDQTAVRENHPNNHLEQLNELLRNRLYEEPLKLLKSQIM